jgi:putative endonuclease
VTNDLIRRCSEHKEGKIKGFTQKYNVNKLVYYEIYEDINLAIEREKQIKGLLRRKKIALIEKANPLWEELIPK